MSTLGAILNWIGLSDNDEHENKPRASLLTLLGASESMHPRILAILTAEQFDACIAQWTIGGQPPMPAQRGQAGLLGRVCRLICGRATDVPPTPPQLTPLPASPATERRIKAAQVINQMDDGDVSVLDPAKLKLAKSRYRTRIGHIPPPEFVASAEQLSAPDALGKSGAPLCVDLAVWGSNHYRLLKKLKLTGMQIMPTESCTTSSSQDHPNTRYGSAA